VAGAGFMVTPGFTNTKNRKKLKILVLGNTGYVPRYVRDSAKLLKDSVWHQLITWQNNQ